MSTPVFVTLKRSTLLTKTLTSSLVPNEMYSSVALVPVPTFPLVSKLPPVIACVVVIVLAVEIVPKPFAIEPLVKAPTVLAPSI